MKVYKSGIVMGLTSVASSFLLLGIPFGQEPFEVMNAAVFAAGIISVLMLGPVMKKYVQASVSSIIYIIALVSISSYIELTSRTIKMCMVGFIPGAVIALAGIITSLQLSGKKRIAPSMVINIIAILLSGASAGLTIMNSGFSIM